MVPKVFEPLKFCWEGNELYMQCNALSSDPIHLLYAYIDVIVNYTNKYCLN